MPSTQTPTVVSKQQARAPTLSCFTETPLLDHCGFTAQVLTICKIHAVPSQRLTVLACNVNMANTSRGPAREWESTSDTFLFIRSCQPCFASNLFSTQPAGLGGQLGRTQYCHKYNCISGRVDCSFLVFYSLRAGPFKTHPFPRALN